MRGATDLQYWHPSASNTTALWKPVLLLLWSRRPVPFGLPIALGLAYIIPIVAGYAGQVIGTLLWLSAAAFGGEGALILYSALRSSNVNTPSQKHLRSNTLCLLTCVHYW